MTHLILQVTCNYYPIVGAIQKNDAYLNELYHHYEIPFYLEQFSGGFLLIMKDFTSLLQFRNSEMLQNKIDYIQQHKIKNILQGITDPNTYPENGITFTIHSPMITPENVYEIIYSNFHQVDKDIDVKLDKSKKIIVNFSTYHSLELYSKICYLFTHDLESQVLCQIYPHSQ